MNINMSVTELYDNSFDAAVSGAFALVEFYAPWCASCRAARPALDAFAEANANGNIGVFTVNVDENPRLAADYNIMSIPTFVVLRNGKTVARSTGAASRGELERLTQAVVG